MRMSIRHVSVAALLAACISGFSGRALAQPLSTTFTYQAELLSAGAPATGLYDLRFRLYDSLLGGAQIGAVVRRDNVTVTNGKFSADLDFGAQFAGLQRFVEIDVRTDAGLGCGDAAGFTTLGPRRQLTATPNALFALNTGTFNGQAPAFYQNAANLNAGLLGSARLSGGYTNMLSLTNIGNTFAGTFAGSGSSLTDLNASSLTLGTVPDARLSSNVALLDTAQIFTASKTFTGTGGSTLSISRATPGGLALNIVNGGGSSIFVNNNAAGLIGYGLNLSVDGTSTKYGVLMDITGASGPGYGIYQSNSTINGRGLQADMSGTGTTYGVRITNNSPTGYGGYFNNTSLTGITYGLYCENNSADGYGIFALHDSSTGTGPAIYGRSDSTSSFAFAIHGLINSTTPGGSSAAVRGENNGAAGSGIGVWGSQDGGGYGVYGTAVNGYGVYGRSSGTGRGVYGYSTGGYGGYFDTGVAGGVALYVNGTASVGVITIRGGADLAEDFAVAGPAEALEPGMVVMIDADHVGGIKLADGAYNKHVAGVLSGANGLSAAMTMGKFEGQVNAKPVALSGRVWAFVDASTGALEPGDLLTTSLTPGPHWSHRIPVALTAQPSVRP